MESRSVQPASIVTAARPDSTVHSAQSHVRFSTTQSGFNPGGIGSDVWVTPVSVNTVASHVKAVYLFYGVGDQRDLMVRLLRPPSG